MICCTRISKLSQCVANPGWELHNRGQRLRRALAEHGRAQRDTEQQHSRPIILPCRDPVMFLSLLRVWLAGLRSNSTYIQSRCCPHELPHLTSRNGALLPCAHPSKARFQINKRCVYLNCKLGLERLQSQDSLSPTKHDDRGCEWPPDIRRLHLGLLWCNRMSSLMGCTGGFWQNAVDEIFGIWSVVIS